MKLDAARRQAGLRGRRVPAQPRRLVQLLRLAGRAGRHAVQVHGARHRDQGADLRLARHRRHVARRRSSRTTRASCPGYRTHTVEHHAIDAAGNIGPGRRSSRRRCCRARKPDCTRTLTGRRRPAASSSTSGVTCLDGATVAGRRDRPQRRRRSSRRAAPINGWRRSGRRRQGRAAVRREGARARPTVVNGDRQHDAREQPARAAASTLSRQRGDAVRARRRRQHDLPRAGLRGDDQRLRRAERARRARRAAPAPRWPPTRRAAWRRRCSGRVGGSRPGDAGADARSGGLSSARSTPGVARNYTATTTANVISTAGDATLTVSDPGHLTNGTFALAGAAAGRDRARTRGAAPVSNDAVDDHVPPARRGPTTRCAPARTRRR